DAGPDLRSDRAAAEDSRALPRRPSHYFGTWRHGGHRPGPAQPTVARGSRGSRLAAASRVSVASRAVCSTSSPTLARVCSAHASSPTDGRLTSTLAAAPRAAASARSAATPRSDEALTLLRP